MTQLTRQRRLPPLLSLLLYFLALAALLAGVWARVSLPGMGARLGQQYDALVGGLGIMGCFMPPLAGLLMRVATMAGTALLGLALLFSLLLFACGWLASRWASLQQRVQYLEQLTAALQQDLRVRSRSAHVPDASI